MKARELREKYLSFFEAKGCKRVPSSSLIPDDPSMLLTSAGMVQFKPWFLQLKQLEEPYIGTTSVQKCVRTTDIDIIGTTGRHLSFFEMLGNFSFGGYFKNEMCAWALEFSLDVLGFDFEKLYFTVYLDDDETIEIWKSLGVPEERIRRLGEKDNFWTAGPTGPCGPCSELYYDQGPEFGCGQPDCGPGCDCDRYLEYWNCVFTQFDRQEDGTLLPLPKKNIDTGMGLERTAAILQGAKSNFETDVLRGLIAVGEGLSSHPYGGLNTGLDLSLRICADHSRALTFMIGDGILPSNEGRSFVLRRLLRRAMRHGHLLGIEAPFLVNYIRAIIAEMGDVYPEIVENQTLIERIVTAEEERFAQTLRTGQIYLDAALAPLDRGGVLSGQAAFELHDRYGFPIDLTIEIAAEAGVSVDRASFEEHMEKQRARARAAVRDDAWATLGGVFSDLATEFGPTRFVGYSDSSIETSVLALIVEEEGKARRVDEVSAGQAAQVVLAATPFYAEMGGQVGDVGWLSRVGGGASDGSAGGGGNSDGTSSPDSPAALFTVLDTHGHDHVFAHIGQATGTLKVGDRVTATIDRQRRERIERNHTATHLLHHALHKVVGDHVKQAGSLVAPDRLRFDFTHFEALSPQQLAAVEDLVNTMVMEDAEVTSHETTLDEARAAGVTALFGEKYGSQVRVIEAGSESRELCGGTHVHHTAEIGFMKIVSEGSVGANIRRIEAVTSFAALDFVHHEEQQLHEAAELLKTRPLELVEHLQALLAKQKELEDSRRADKQAALAGSADDLLASRVAGAPYVAVVQRQEDLEIDDLRKLWDRLRELLAKEDGYDGAAALVLGTTKPDGGALLLAAGTEAAVKAGFHAGALIKAIAPLVKGGGGGKPEMAQAGGKDATGLDAALARAREILATT